MPQLFGSISEKGNFTYTAMFCSDTDQSDVVTISWWKEGDAQSNAITFEMNSNGGEEFLLTPKTFYRTDDNGGLLAPKLDEDDAQRVRNISVILTRTSQSGYQGYWAFSGEIKGQIFFNGINPLLNSIALEPTICNEWSDFKKWADGFRGAHSECAFRGHGSNSWQLSTTFSRSGRTRLERYYDETIQVFRTHAEVAMDRDFDLSSSAEYATLLGLAQHHGLPTPLLDITDSPYVAAYFAFADAVEYERASTDFVRVYAFAGSYLRDQTMQTVALAGARPYLTPLSVSPRHNPRLYAQQGRFIVTNIVNLQPFLLAAGNGAKQKILFAADIPVHCAFEALQDLKFMGLTAGTLFPGLDGVSKMIKQMMMVSNAKHKLELMSDATGKIVDQSTSVLNDSNSQLQNDDSKI